MCSGAARGMPTSPEKQEKNHQKARVLVSAGAVLLVVVSAVGCATVPRGRFGIESLEIQGMEALDDESLETCLATQERPVFRLCFGSCKASTSCGVPPFDGGRLSLLRFSWPWTDWELFDRSVFERDQERIRRWFRARGYYDAEIVEVSVDPPEALERFSGAPRSDGEDDDCEDDCEVEIVITVREGEPVLVEGLDVEGIDNLPLDIKGEVWDQIELEPGERFDEAFYDRSKSAIAKRLGDLGYAHAEVGGTVNVDPDARTATVTYTVDSGPVCRFGAITVEPIEPPDCQVGDFVIVEDQEIPLDVIRETALLEADGPGTSQQFSSERIAEARRAIYELGAFSAVQVIPNIPEDRSDPVIPVTIRAEPGRICRLGVGVGFLSGIAPELGTVDLQAVPRWDIHLSLSAESRNFFGGLRRLRIEERPRVIFENQFPLIEDEPAPGNLLRLEFTQPAFLEARTNLVVQADWDLGPDPFEEFFRHSVDFLMGPERLFFDGRLFAAARIGTVIQVPLETTPQAETWEAVFLEQFLRLDLRDKPTDPTEGFFAQLDMQQAGLVPVSSWSYFRFEPDLRAYLPLPFGIVLAARFSMGALFIVDIADTIDDDQIRNRGPNPFRLRGGGPTSNRGYLAGQLGDSERGGLRSWQASVELRVPLTTNFLVVFFADAGDVHSGLSWDDGDGAGDAVIEDPRFRFNVPHLSPGFGFRYRTPIGAIRLDIGFAPPGVQSFSDNAGSSTCERGMETVACVGAECLCNPAPNTVNLGFVKFDGAIHLTVGEAF